MVSRKTREKHTVAKIQKWLASRPASWFFKSHGSVYQMAGLPDLIGCYQGRFCGLEVKVPGEEASKLQLRILGLIRRAGGIAGVVRSLEEAQDLVATAQPTLVLVEQNGTACIWRCLVCKCDYVAEMFRTCPACMGRSEIALEELVDELIGPEETYDEPQPRARLHRVM